MGPLRIDMLDGSFATIDPGSDPVGYKLALEARLRNRSLAGLAQQPSTNPAMWGNPGIQQDFGPFFEAEKVIRENNPGMKFRTNYADMGPTHKEGPANIARDPNSNFATQQGPYGSFGIGTGGIEDREPFDDVPAINGLKKAKPTIKAVR